MNTKIYQSYFIQKREEKPAKSALTKARYIAS